MQWDNEIGQAHTTLQHRKETLSLITVRIIPDSLFIKWNTISTAPPTEK